MPSKLQKLIAAVEAEKAALEARIQECLLEQEYHLAHRCLKETRRLHEQLTVLYPLVNEQFAKKEAIRSYIARLEKQACSAESEGAAYLADYLATMLAAAQAELQHLLQQLAKPDRPTGSTVLHDVLLRLWQRQLPGFTLVVSAKHRLQCTVRAVRQTLILTLPEVQRHRQEHTLEKRQLKRLQRLGFSYYDQKDKLMCFVPFFSEQDSGGVKTLLARMVFEVFYTQKGEGEAFIRPW